jgi:REP element-mobilizing transposase RayT
MNNRSRKGAFPYYESTQRKQVFEEHLLALRAREEKPMSALAYHITWTTYGTWLSGDARGWVRWGEFGIKPPDPEWERDARERMAEAAVLLSDEQRSIVEQTIRDHCRIRGWLLRAVNVRTNHVHVVVTANREAVEVMNQLKAWCSRKLSDAAGLVGPVAKKAGRRHWFTEGGDKQTIDTEDYFANAIRYVSEGQ